MGTKIYPQLFNAGVPQRMRNTINAEVGTYVWTGERPN